MQSHLLHYLDWHGEIPAAQSTSLDVKWTPFWVEIILNYLHKSKSTKLKQNYYILCVP